MVPCHAHRPSLPCEAYPPPPACLARCGLPAEQVKGGAELELPNSVMKELEEVRLASELFGCHTVEGTCTLDRGRLAGHHPWQCQQ